MAVVGVVVGVVGEDGGMEVGVEGAGVEELGEFGVGVTAPVGWEEGGWLGVVLLGVEMCSKGWGRRGEWARLG